MKKIKDNFKTTLSLFLMFLAIGVVGLSFSAMDRVGAVGKNPTTGPLPGHCVKVEFDNSSVGEIEGDEWTYEENSSLILTKGDAEIGIELDNYEYDDNNFVGFGWNILYPGNVTAEVWVKHGNSSGNYDSGGSGTVLVPETQSGGSEQYSRKAISNIVFCIGEENGNNENGDTVTIKAHKIVCEDESLLPNWVTHENEPYHSGRPLTEKDILEYEHLGNGCWLVDDWYFEWAEDGTNKLNGDVIGTAEENDRDDWNTFGPTEDGVATIEIDLEGRSKIWIREVLQEGYIRFAHPDGDWEGPGERESAELICHTDGWKYDNYNSIDDLEGGGEYYCVAFNAPKTVTINAYKVICEDESDLPNWARKENYPFKEGSELTKAYIDDYIEGTTCRFVSDWEFQWGDENATKMPGSHFGEGDDTWNTFGPTDENGKATVTLPYEEGVSHFWVREVLKQGYLPFSDSEDGDYSVSAEMLCHIDGYKYDNHDRVDNPEPGGEYTCVAFNMPVVTIKAQKVVCDDERDLPDWVKTSDYPYHSENYLTKEDITDYVNDENNNCWFETDWEFEWGYDGIAEKQDGDFIGKAGVGKGWNDFDSVTGGECSPAIATIKDLSLSNKIWVREVLQDGYIPFAHPKEGWDTGEKMESAELICHTDGYKYDNYDYVEGVEKGNYYYCVAFNVPEKMECDDIVIVSNTNDKVKEAESNIIATTLSNWANAVLTWAGHENWTANIPGANWIWKTEEVENPEENETYYFKKNFDVYGSASSATLQVAADNSYKVWINDCFEKASLAEDNYSQETTYSIEKSCFKEEGNVIKFKVKNWEQPGGTWETNPAGLLYRLDIERDTCYDSEEPGNGDSGNGGDGSDNNEGNNDGGGDVSQGTTGSSRSGGSVASLMTSPLAQEDDEENLPEEEEETEGEILGKATEGPCGMYLFEHIKYGADNNPEEVKKLQTFLNDHMGENLPVTGFYGDLTRAAVNRFQLEYKDEVLRPWVDAGIHTSENTPTGYVFVTTKRWINMIMCPELNISLPDLSVYRTARATTPSVELTRAVSANGSVLGEEDEIKEEEEPEEEVEEILEVEDEDIDAEEEEEGGGMGRTTLWATLVTSMMGLGVVTFYILSPIK